MAAAKLICTNCPVRQECLEYALDNNETFGVWGGTSEKQRRQLRRQRRQPGPKPIRHGTPAGYEQHRGRGEPACQACRDAIAAYQRDARRRYRQTDHTPDEASASKYAAGCRCDNCRAAHSAARRKQPAA